MNECLFQTQMVHIRYRKTIKYNRDPQLDLSKGRIVSQQMLWGPDLHIYNNLIIKNDGVRHV